MRLLSPAELVPFMHNALTTYTDANGLLCFSRFTPEQTARYRYDSVRLSQNDLYAITFASSNITLEMDTDSSVFGIASSLVCLVISIPLGIISAVKHGTLIDNGSMVLALLGLSMPNFWLGLLLIIVFAQKLGWFPSYGRDVWYSIILPAFTIGTGQTAILTRTTRSSMLDVIRQDYLRTARSKGVSEKKVITKHALKNALIPIITIIGSNFAGIIGGAALTETVFTWPGVGRLLVESIGQRDVPLATGTVVMTSVLTSLILLAIDILYAYVDPRIKGNYTKGKKKKA